MEIAVSAAFFTFACIAFLSLSEPGDSVADRVAGLGLFVLLVGSYLGFSIHAMRRPLGAALPAGPGRTLAGPAILLGAVAAYAAVAGLPLRPTAAGFGVYLLAPALILAPSIAMPGHPPVRELLAALLLWLPIELGRLPELPIPAPAGYDAARLVGLAAGLYLFLAARPLDGIGYTFRLGRADVRAAAIAFLAFAVPALPLGFATGFLVWRPSFGAEVLLAPGLIFLVTAVPEEFLFRGLLQNLLTRWLGARAALAIAAVVFGLAHLPDPRYVVLATLAGVAYGWVYLRTGKITAAALTHAAVDWVWGVVLGG